MAPPTSPTVLSPVPGLKRIHALTTQAAYELHVDLEDFDNGTAYAHYGSFGVGLLSVDPEEDGYTHSLWPATRALQVGLQATAGMGKGKGSLAVSPAGSTKAVFPGQDQGFSLHLPVPTGPHTSHVKLAGPHLQNHPFCR